MLLKLLYDPKLAQASYLVGCQATGEAIVIDPNRDVAAYLAAARAEGLAVRHVTETHIHADFASGSRELAHVAGARLYLSAEGGEGWQYTFAADAGATLLRDGDSIQVGNVRLDVLHTPGHTPEHLSFALTDGAATDRPMGVFTGDFVFVGDVGRPDLLERAAGVEGTMEAGTRQLFASLQRFKQLPDYLQIWPGHGAGSACGKALGAVPSSTLGYERFANWGLAFESEDAFAAAVLSGQPEPPAYFAHMKRINRDGPPLLGEIAPPPRQDSRELARAIRGGAQVVDLRPTRDFAARHVPGTFNIPGSRSFLTYAGTVLDYARPVHLLVPDQAAALAAARELTLIGLDHVEGWFGTEVLEGAGGNTPQWTPEEAAARFRAGGAALVDVRGRAEWDALRIPGAVHVPLGDVARRAPELPEGPLVCLCETGSRSAVAASVLRSLGRTEVFNLTGGLAGWAGAGLPVER